MGAQRLSERNVRKWAARTGLPIVRMWAFGGYTHDFAVVDPEHPDGHRHGSVDIKTGEWEWENEPVDPMARKYRPHYESCSEWMS